MVRERGPHTRITPACAGITRGQPLGHHFRQDHPRVCWNYATRELRADSETGSPPRVRELQITEIVPLRDLGITPACAGITFDFEDAFVGVAGSPPRVRELQIRGMFRRGVRRITPACAGITKEDDGSETLFRDHPRVRELLHAPPPRRGYNRITPACAGITKI